MRAIFAITTALVFATSVTAECCGPVGKSTESEELWGAPVGGLSTRVTSLEKEPAVGRPLKVLLEVKNVDSVARTFDDQQAAVNGSIIVKGPDGKDVPYIGTSFQTMGQKTELAPGAVKIVIKELDIASQYLLERDGKHTVQFRSRGGLPASNALSVILKSGELPDIMKLFASIHRAAPAGWRAAKYDNSIILLNTPTHLKADATSISLYFTQQGHEAMREGRTEPLFLGVTKLGKAKIVLEPKAAERWPEHVKFFQDQLKPFAKSN